MRLPPRPDLEWKDDGTPVDRRVGDVYYSVEDGLEESRAVFLAGCRLPEVWQGRSSFTIAELGFGTGLNFLATWQLWRDHKPNDGWLNFVSFEGFPLDREDIERALIPWPELSDLADELCAKWPPRAKGVRQLVWPDERLTLTLHIGLIEETLPAASFRADAWFLDGFSPAKNEAMWDESLWPLIAERSAPGARAGTFTVAGAVRRGLTEHGFDVAKRPGHGRKRERLEARFTAARDTTERDEPHTPSVAIIGAGISGACLARTLSDRGASVQVFDTSSGPAKGTSGNPLALIMPRLDASDSVQARLLIDAYLKAQTFYEGLTGVARTETVHKPRNEKEAARFEKLLADPPLGLEQLEALRGGGLLHKRSLILKPSDLLPALLGGIDVTWNVDPQIDQNSLIIDGSKYDAIILANGWHLQDLAPDLDLTARLGQIEFYESDVQASPQAVAQGPYALALNNTRLWGATFEDHDLKSPEVSDRARDENAASLEELNPYWRAEAKNAEIVSRAGVRATTADRLPLIGPMPDVSKLISARKELERQAWSIDWEAFAQPGIFVSGGFGSRGFTWAPWAASILTAHLFDDPIPARLDALNATVPNRQILRKLKRRA